MIRLTAIVTGKVQGVHYRAFAQDAATELDIVGTIQNDPTDTVTVLAEGPPEVLKEFVEYLHEGSLLSEVAGVSVEWGSATGTFSDFSVLQ